MKQLLALCILFLTQLNLGFSQTEVGRTILKIGHFNFDNVQDTLIGIQYKSDSTRKASTFVVPSILNWGRSSALDSNRRKKISKSTVFDFPKWKMLYSNCLIERVNQDSLWDIVFWIDGTSKGKKKTERDTSIKVVLLGQDKISFRDEVRITNVQGIERNPVTLVQFREDAHLKENKSSIGKSKKISQLKKMYVDAEPLSKGMFNDAVDEKQLISWDSSLVEVQLSPNPAQDHVNVSIATNYNGLIEMKIIDNLGTTRFVKNVSLGKFNTNNEIVNVSFLENGQYQFVIEIDESVVATNSFVIIR